MGTAGSVITTPFHETPQREPPMMDAVYYSVRVQGLTFSLRVSVLKCFLMRLHVTVFGSVLHTGASVILQGSFNILTVILILFYHF